jgi:hypothetical protein
MCPLDDDDDEVRQLVVCAVDPGWFGWQFSLGIME